MACKYTHHSILLLFVVVLSGYLLDQDVLAMEPNLIPEPPIENSPDRRDAPPLPLTPIVKSNKRFFRPAPRSFVQADRGSPPLPNPPPNSWPADVRHKFAGDVTAEQYDARKRTEVIRPPTTLKFDVDESPRIAREDRERNATYAFEGNLLKKALKDEADDSSAEQQETMDTRMVSAENSAQSQPGEQ